MGLTAGVIAAAVLGMALVSELWWTYFDVVALVGSMRLARATAGREQNALARDAYSYMHFLLVAGIVLAAFGLHETLAHVSDPLALVPAFGLLGGVALYMVGHVVIRYRHVRSLNRQAMAQANSMWYVLMAVEHEPVSHTISYDPAGAETTVEVRRLHVVRPEPAGHGDCSHCPAHSYECAREDWADLQQTITSSQTRSASE